MLWLISLLPASDDIPAAGAAGAATAAAQHSYPSDLDTLLHGLVAAAVVKLVQVVLSSAIEGLKKSIGGDKASPGDKP